MQKLILTIALPLVFGSTILSSCKEKAKETTTKRTTKVAEPTAVAVTATPEIMDTAAAASEITETNTDKTETTSKATTSQKFGYINSADLIKIMPETKRAEASLAAYVKTLEKDMTGLQAEYQKKVTDYQAQERSMVDAIKQTKIQAIQNLEQQMQESQMAGQQKISAKREALFKPILDKAEKAIKEVGKENGYDFVFDTNSGAFVYSSESHDVMPLVKTKLGLK